MIKKFIVFTFIIGSLISGLLNSNSSDLGDDVRNEYKTQTRSSLVFVKSSNKYSNWFKILSFSIENVGKEQTQTFTIPFQFYKASQTYKMSFYYTNYNNEKTLCGTKSLTSGTKVASNSKSSFSYTIDSRDYYVGEINFSIYMTCTNSSGTLICSQEIPFKLSKYNDLYVLSESTKQFYYKFSYVPKSGYGYGYSYLWELSFQNFIETNSYTMEYDSIDPDYFKVCSPNSTSTISPYLIIDNPNNYYNEFELDSDSNKAYFPLFLKVEDETNRIFKLALLDEECGGTYSFYYDRNSRKMTKTSSLTTEKISAITLPIEEDGAIESLNCRLMATGLSDLNVTFCWDFTINFTFVEDEKNYSISEEIGKISDNDFFED